MEGFSKLNEKISFLETELEAEKRKYAEASQNLHKDEKYAKELIFQVDENAKIKEKLEELVEYLTQKTTSYKKQLEDAEEIAALNFAKYKTMQQGIDEANHRFQVASEALSKLI